MGPPFLLINCKSCSELVCETCVKRWPLCRDKHAPSMPTCGPQSCFACGNQEQLGKCVNCKKVVCANCNCCLLHGSGSSAPRSVLDGLGSASSSSCPGGTCIESSGPFRMRDCSPLDMDASRSIIPGVLLKFNSRFSYPSLNQFSQHHEYETYAEYQLLLLYGQLQTSHSRESLGEGNECR